MVGESVEVLYDPRNTLMRVSTDLPVVRAMDLGGPGAVFIAIGVSILLAGRMGEKGLPVVRQCRPDRLAESIAYLIDGEWAQSLARHCSG